jgi:hypothetical protein
LAMRSRARPSARAEHLMHGDQPRRRLDGRIVQVRAESYSVRAQRRGSTLVAETRSRGWAHQGRSRGRHASLNMGERSWDSPDVSRAVPGAERSGADRAPARGNRLRQGDGHGHEQRRQSLTAILRVRS